jgi:DNA invertase Pin-like site-specific DNA recombinase
LKKKKCYICLRKSLHSEEHKKYKLGEDLDHLDVLSDDYETEYEAITSRIDKTYDRIYELQEQIDKKRERLAGLRNGVDSTDNVRLILDNIDRLFRSMKFAAFQEMEVVREYCDAGKSGKSITGRPEFTKMLQDVAESGEDIDFILVFKLSRFGRNAADVLNSLQYIQDYGVNLICVEDGIDSSKDSGKLTITVLSAVAEIERENILVQTMEGRKQKAREGKWNGGQAPFGYTLDSKNSTLNRTKASANTTRALG